MLTTFNRTKESSRRREANDGEARRTYIAPFLTELNWMAVAWRDEELEGNAFGHASRRSAELSLARLPGLAQSFCRIDIESQAAELPDWAAELIGKLQRFAEGEPVDFSSTPLAFDHLTSFGRHVVAACRRIPWGQTRSYGELAAECGSPGAARAVGSVMAKNRYPLIVPCHRVLAAGGELGGYSAPDGLKMKERLLEMECFTADFTRKKPR
ncbi:MAG TPA: methylated-DNA--[protein]-cysteine S-methyltransferase [Lacipirellulaceae bacterium]|nr:methylated-DNA--[protein]-cysteine S-methyltransferase [Lacipirellulaceae bacterium]